jgi:phosphoglycerate dehydrogenase-like enzyme
MGDVEDVATFRYTATNGLADELLAADALFVWDALSTPMEPFWPRDVDARREIRWVHKAAAGVDTLMFPALRDSETVVTNSRGVFDGPIAEFVLATVLAFAKRMPESMRLQERREWRHRETERIAGAAALVVGTGAIGRAIARLLSAAGLRVTGIGRRERSGDPDFGVVHSSESLLKYLPAADYVISVAPLTDATRGMFDRRAFAAMKPTARLVNVGRGAAVVTEDLVDALWHAEIAGAALDVVETEPLPADSPLWDMPGTLISPHMAGDAHGWQEALAELFRDNLRRWVEGKPLLNVIDKSRGY